MTSSLDYDLSRAEDSLVDDDAEQLLIVAVLSSVFRPSLPDLVDELAAGDFYDPHRGAVWHAAAALVHAGETITRRRLFATAKLNDAVAHRILAEVARDPLVQWGRLREAITRVSELARMRALVQVLKRTAQHIETSPGYSQSLHFTHEQLAGLTHANPSKDAKPFSEILVRWHEWLEAPREKSRTFATPWYQLDDYLSGGLHPGRTYVIGARPGQGKSVLLLNMAAHAAELNHPTVIFSVEMGDLEVASRVMTAGSSARYSQVTRRSVDAENRLLLAEYEDSHAHMPLTVIDRSDVTVDYVAAQCRTLKRRPEGLDVVVVDYLQLLRESDTRASRERQVAQISRALKVLARELDVVVLIACQLNRNSAAGDRKPTLADLRESGSIEQDADVVILLHHELINNEPTGKVELCIAKNRTGRSGAVNLRQAFHRARFE